MERRTFVRGAVLGTGAVVLGGSLWRGAAAAPAQPGAGPYGAIGGADGNGIRLPAGFTSRSAPSPPPTGSCPTPIATAPAARPRGIPGSPAKRSAAATSTRPTRRAGRQRSGGRRWAGSTTRRPRSTRSAGASITEDEGNGCLYRFVPSSWPSMAAGRLDVLRGGSGTAGSFTWAQVPDPDRSPTAPAARCPGSSGSTAARARCMPTTRSGSPPRATTGCGSSTSRRAPSNSPTTTR